VLEAIRLTDAQMRRAGFSPPRIAVAALNPHAGEGGAFGREEIDVIAPAVAEARAGGIEAHGPFPSDTVYLRARDGQYDSVVTMYHDQGQIAIKLLGFSRGVTLLGGLPVAVTTPAQGTAYDIAGNGVATVDALKNAFALARTLGAA
jgi:4-hydroxythreonine-4-phosphate dehydrogenase